MQRTLLLILSLIISSLVYSESFNVYSPDSTIRVKIDIEDVIRYSVFVDENEVLSPSVISMTLSSGYEFGKLPKIKSHNTSFMDETVLPVVRQKSAKVRDHYTQFELWIKGNYGLDFRVFNEGVAYRFKTRFKDKVTVVSENCEFNFTHDNYIYFPEETSFISHNERYYEYLKVRDITPEMFGSLPMLVQTKEGLNIVISESDLENYAGMWLKGNSDFSLKGIFPHYPKRVQQEGDRLVKVSEYDDFIATTEGKRTFPWRIMAIARTDKEILSNQMPFLLSKENVIKDVSWIKPGKVAWDWWNYNNIYGVDFRAGVNTQTYKYYIDFAADYGLEYIIMDEGWYELGDLMKIVPDIDMEAIMAHAKEKGVGVILWVVWKTLDDQLEEALDKFEAWGVKGIKVDFMQRDDYWMVDYYHRIAKAAAEHHLLVDYHGSYKPAGLHRKYPNVLTREGVKGLENCKWSDKQTPEHDVTLPFIRMFAGPMDYTPGAMENAQPNHYKISWNRPMSMGTRCHQIAMYVVYESPLQMLADNPSNYMREEETTRFIAQIPVTWDETVPLDSKIGDYIAVARKNGENWYIGVMGDLDPHELEIDFSFLSEGRWEMEIFQDGINADRTAKDYKHNSQSIGPFEKEVIKLAPGGGWAAIIRPVE